MRRLFTIEHDVFDSETLVAIGVSDDRIIKWLQECTDLEVTHELKRLIECHGYGRTVMSGSFTMLRLKDFSDTNRQIGTVAHEAFHLAEMVFDRIGIKHDIDASGEAFAYFIQHTVKQVLDVCRK